MPVRPRLPTDPEEHVDLWLRSVRATHDFLTEADIQTFLPFVREYLSSPETDLWVLCLDAGAVMGFKGMREAKWRRCSWIPTTTVAAAVVGS